MYFDGIKEGHTVFFIARPCNVIDVYDSYFRISLGNGQCLFIGMDGARRDDTSNTQIVFWQPVPITPPPRPKRKVMKTIVRFVNVYRDPSKIDGYFMEMFYSREAAKRTVYGTSLITCVEIPIPFEVEE
jgi:hypothetical protein